MPATTPPSLVLTDRVFGATSGVKPPQDNEQAAPPSLPPPPKAPTHAHGGAAGAGAGAGTDDFTFTQDKVDCPNGIDYDRVVDMFGVQLINHKLIARVEALTGRSAHLFLKRGLFFAHRDLEPILDAYEKGEPFYLYTGRGPSRGSLHLGHVIPFEFTRYLQEAFQVPVIIQLTDDEKFLKKGLTLAEVKANTIETVKDIIALGFDPDLTYVFSNFNLIQQLYPAVCEIQRHLTCNQVSHCFGVSGSDSVGRMAFPAIQMAPCFSGVFPTVLSLKPPADAGASPDDATPVVATTPAKRKGKASKSTKSTKRIRCLVPCGVDQDPYFRMTRDIARHMKHPKPAVIHSKFLPSLDGIHTKMNSTPGAASSSGAPQAGPIMLSDTPKRIAKKIGRAFSGGQETLELHRKLGADLSVDVPIKYLSLFLRDEAKYDEVASQYAAGVLTSGQVKKLAAQAVAAVVVEHQRARAGVTDDDVALFMSQRPLFARRFAAHLPA